MTVTIDGTSGIAGIDGSAATPAAQGADTNTGIFYGTDIVGVSTGGTERMRIDSSGNVGIGVTPSAWGSGWKALEFIGGTGLANNGGNALTMTSNAYWNGTNYIYKNNWYASYYQQNDGKHIWNTAPSGTAGNAISFTQAMTLDASGNLLVGTTSELGAGGLTLQPNFDDGAARITFNRNSTTASSISVVFNNAGVTSGQISYTNTATTFSTSSDYRLKENIQPMTGALATVAQLNPVTYTWKADGSVGQGFIAHELQAVVPDCVTGEKDAVDAEGNPVYQGIDTSFLVATLTKAIQELSAKNDALEARLAALEAK